MLDKYSVAFPARDAFHYGLSREFYNEFSEFRHVFENASDFMHEDLYDIAYMNPNIKAEFHTVCLITHCLALYRILLQYVKKPCSAIGFSQGEFAAVSAAGSVAFPEILGLIYELELLLRDDMEMRQGSMVRVVGLDRETLRACCEAVDPIQKYISISITYSNDQNVVSGRSDEIIELTKLAKEKGARWVIHLEGDGAFHSPLCSNLLLASKQLFERYTFQNAEYAVFSCMDGSLSINGEQIREKLSKQIAVPILWDELIRNNLKNGNKFILELGPGCTVSGNTRIIDERITCNWINNMSDFKNVIKLVEGC